MTDERRTLYGFRGRSVPQSVATVVTTPLVGGLRLDLPPDGVPEGSSVSMQNVILRDGRVARRSVWSRFDSNANGFGIIGGIFEFGRSSNAAAVGWVSQGTRHYFYDPTAGMSVASFVSAAGLGSVGSGQDPTTNNTWQAAPIYAGILDDNVLVLAAHSNDTLLCGYWNVAASTTSMLLSYVTGAPRAKAVTAFDNFVVAFNTYEPGDGGPLLTRVRWSDRGDPFNWTVGNTLAGFEDLLQMRGVGTAIKAMGSRLYLFSDTDVWIGGRGSDVFTFQFQEFKGGIGCPHPLSIQHTPLGFLYLDRDARVRLLPQTGGPSQVVSQAIDADLRAAMSPKEILRSANNASRTHAIYHPQERVYRLHVHNNLTTTNYSVFALHLDTGAWTRDTDVQLSAGAAWYDVGAGGAAGPPPGPIAGSIYGDLYSTNTLLDGTSTVGGASDVLLQTPPMLAEDARTKTVTAVRVTYDATSASTATVSLMAARGATALQNYVLAMPASSVATVATAYLYGTAHAPVIQVASNSTGYRLHEMQTLMQMSGR